MTWPILKISLFNYGRNHFVTGNVHQWSFHSESLHQIHPLLEMNNTLGLATGAPWNGVTFVAPAHRIPRPKISSYFPWWCYVDNKWHVLFQPVVASFFCYYHRVYIDNVYIYISIFLKGKISVTTTTTDG